MRRYMDYELPDRLPTCVAEARTIAEHMDLVLRETQADMVARGNDWLKRNKSEPTLSQGQLSALRQGREPAPAHWPLYQAALKIDDALQFYRLMRNTAKIAALQAPVDMPLLDLIEYEDRQEGQVVKYRNTVKGVGERGGSDVFGSGQRKDSVQLDDGERSADCARSNADDGCGVARRSP